MAETTKKAAAPKKPRATTPKKTTKAKVVQMKASHEQIAVLAHQIWTESGGTHGHDADDWFRAEQMLLSKAS